MEFDPLYVEDIAIIQLLNDDMVRSLDMPEEEAAAEGHRLEAALREDEEALKAAGCPAIYIDSYPQRLALFTYLCNYLLFRLDQTEDAQAHWIARKIEGYGLRKRLIRAFKVAYRNNPKVLEDIKKIERGRTDTDMIFDLLKLYRLAISYPAELATVAVSPEMVDQAQAQYLELSALLADSDLATDVEREVRELRNRSYSWLREAMDEIRLFGQWIHEDDEEKQLRYISLYHHELGVDGSKARWSETAAE